MNIIHMRGMGSGPGPRCSDWSQWVRELGREGGKGEESKVFTAEFKAFKFQHTGILFIFTDYSRWTNWFGGLGLKEIFMKFLE